MNYNGQKNVLSEGISKRVLVKWKIVHQGGTTTNTRISLHNNPNWYKGEHLKGPHFFGGIGARYNRRELLQSTLPVPSSPRGSPPRLFTMNGKILLASSARSPETRWRCGI